MLIRFKTTMAGPLGLWEAGKEHEVEDADAARIVAAGFAERVIVAPPVVETAEDPRPVIAETRKAVKGRRK